jgi:hypothetical protein
VKDLWRRLRGALGIALTWAALWVILGSLLMLVLVTLDPQQIDPGEGPATALPILALVGFLSGLGFAALFALAERRRTTGDLSIPRAALWGLLGGVTVPLLMGADARMGWITGPVGALFAAASIAIARRGAPRAVPPRGPTMASPNAVTRAYP